MTGIVLFLTAYALFVTLRLRDTRRDTARRIAALEYENQQMLQDAGAVFERGRQLGRREERAEWEASPLFKRIHDQVTVELLGVAVETDVVRQRGELTDGAHS